MPVVRMAAHAPQLAVFARGQSTRRWSSHPTLPWLGKQAGTPNKELQLQTHQVSPPASAARRATVAISGDGAIPPHFQRQAPRQPRTEAVYAPPTSPQPKPASSAAPKNFASYDVYKGKAALQMTPVPATTEVTSKGNVLVARQGGMLFEVAPSLPGQQRAYDWSQKQIILLSPTEVGEMMEVAAADGRCKFYHDPGKGDPSREGQVGKQFSVSPLPDGKGYYFQLDVMTKGQNTWRCTVPVSLGEFAVMRSVCAHFIPHFLGMTVAPGMRHF